MLYDFSLHAYLRERQESGRQGGGYAQQVVHDVLISALLSHVYQHLVEVDRAHLFDNNGVVPCLNGPITITGTMIAMTIAIKVTATIVHDTTVTWYTFELHGMTAVAHPRRQPRQIIKTYDVLLPPLPIPILEEASSSLLLVLPPTPFPSLFSFFFFFPLLLLLCCLFLLLPLRLPLMQPQNRI